VDYPFEPSKEDIVQTLTSHNPSRSQLTKLEKQSNASSTKPAHDLLYQSHRPTLAELLISR
jgi:hypothetical protein